MATSLAASGFDYVPITLNHPHQSAEHHALAHLLGCVPERHSLTLWPQQLGPTTREVRAAFTAAIRTLWASSHPPLELLCWRHASFPVCTGWLARLMHRLHRPSVR